MLNPARTLAIAGLLLAPLAVPAITPGAASASTDGTRVVISEVYGAGGNSGALYNRDFVELYNPADAAVDLDGLSVQYRSATGTRTRAASSRSAARSPERGTSCSAWRAARTAWPSRRPSTRTTPRST